MTMTRTRGDTLEQAGEVRRTPWTRDWARHGSTTVPRITLKLHLMVQFFETGCVFQKHDSGREAVQQVMKCCLLPIVLFTTLTEKVSTTSSPIAICNFVIEHMNAQRLFLVVL